MTEVEDIIKKVSPYYAKKEKPETSHEIVYNSATEQLEPLYFWILDFMGELGLSTEKLTDSFTSSPGSGHFSEQMGKATAMQQQATKSMADINTVLRSVMNLVYDLKDFKTRLQVYDDLKSDKKEFAFQSLKQLWLDKVDMQKGQGSIHAMTSGQLGFQTLRDAFLSAKDEEAVNKIDLNDRVKRILQARVHEFYIWLKESEKELRKRYAIERSYLKSQTNSLKLYSRWAKPYLKAAQQLEMKESGREPSLVKVFNTLLLELTLLGKKKVDPPMELGDFKPKRDYYACVLVDFTFRSIPQRVAQQSHYAFGGKANITFKGYALNSEEIEAIDKELAKSDVADVLKLIEGTTTESLDQLQEDIDMFLKEEDEGKKEEKPKDASNPFLALIGHYDKAEKKDKPKTKSKKDKDEPVKKDDWTEDTYLRPKTADDAKETTFMLFDVYKKAHGMPSYT
ncbi:MAG: hypothetical protein KKF65_04970 [Nanoarchaeota archaeon]|nr:hypothetical protein [Nanoarchaeota archaeon]